MARESTAVELMAEALCPVVIVRTPSDRRAGGPVVVGVGNADDSSDAVEAAFCEASGRGCNLVVVHASDSDILDRDWVWRIINDRRAVHPGVPVELHSVLGDPADALLGRSAQARLLVLGSQGRHEVDGAVFGSVGQVLIRRTSCPVLVARPGTLRRSKERRDAHVP